jgi:type IV secretion system protein VirB9
MTMRLLALFALLAMAQAEPPGVPADPRIQLLPYSPDHIVTLGVGAGYAAVIELAPDERVDNVVVGNSGAWQVTANHRGDRVIVKPLAGAAPTNMIVLTDSRRYVFMLDPFGQASFVMRFSYPQPPEQAASRSYVATYKFRGNRALFPAAMYDDGRQTIITWSKQSVLPATFAMNDGSHEQLVNGRMVGNDFVIEGAALHYKFRFGDAEAIATRQVAKQPR